MFILRHSVLDELAQTLAFDTGANINRQVPRSANTAGIFIELRSTSSVGDGRGHSTSFPPLSYSILSEYRGQW